MIKELPEKWAIQSTIETGKAIYSWLRMYKQTSSEYSEKFLNDADMKSVIHYPAFVERNEDLKHQSDKLEKDYVEITFEEFEQYVLRIKPIPSQDYEYLIPILQKYNIK